MCSPQDLPFLTPACSLRCIESRAVDILFWITLLNTLLVMNISVIPLQFLLRLTFPFFDSLTINRVFQATGISSSSSHNSLKISLSYWGRECNCCFFFITTKFNGLIIRNMLVC